MKRHRRKTRRDFRIEDVVRVVEVPGRGDIPGIGYEIRGAFVTYHVTDKPREVLRFLKKAGSRSKLIAAYGERGRSSELGPGFYVSGNPNLWMGRARGKWSFLKKLTKTEEARLLSALEGELATSLKKRWLTQDEYERALRDIHYVREGHYDAEALVGLAGQPYNIPFWKPEMLASIGVRAGEKPGILELKIRGRFAELSRSYARPEILRTLRRARLQGAYTMASMGSSAEMVIWDPRAIVSARVDEE